MRVGACIFNQNYTDWDRYEAEERGEAVAARPGKTDREVFNEELNIARVADETGFNAVWTIEHHFTPYTMVTNPLQYLTYVAGITKRVDLGTMVTVPLPERVPPLRRSSTMLVMVRCNATSVVSSPMISSASVSGIPAFTNTAS